MRFFCLFASLFFFVTTAWSAQPPAPPPLAAKAWLLFDHVTGQTLVAHKADERIEPASLTKLMTAYVTFIALRNGSIQMDQIAAVSEKAWHMEGSRMFIEPRKKVTVNELIHGMIIQSGNDACVALAELIAGSEEAFVHLMNREAKRLGMTNTHFTNASGLPDPELYTTANDLGRLTSALIRDFPEFYQIYSKKEYSYNKITQPNRNRLLWMDPTVDGVKTGHTDAAGYCLVASAERGPRRLVSVLLGAGSESIRAQESLKLLNYGFQFFNTAKLYDARQALSRFKVWQGEAGDVGVGFLKPFMMTLPKGSERAIQVKLSSMQPIMAPVQQGQTLGAMQVLLHGKLIGEYPVVALEDVPEAGFFGRVWDGLRLWLQQQF